MATTPQYAATPDVNSATVSISDTSLVLPTNAVTVFTAGASGSRIDYINFAGVSSTTAGLVNLFIYNGSTYWLWRQVSIQTATYSTTSPSTLLTLSSNANADFMPLTLPTGYSLRATVTVTQPILITQSNTAAAALASPASGALVTMSTAANTTAVAAAATVSSAYYTLTTTPYVMTNPAQVTLTSTGNQSAITFTVRGLDATGTAISENITGPNNTTVISTNVFSQVFSVYTSATMTGTTSVGFGSVYAPTFPTTITQTSTATSNTGVTWAIKGINSSGTTITENLTGAAAGSTVTSANTYRVVTSITAGASATNASFGVPATYGGIRITASGGDF